MFLRDVSRPFTFASVATEQTVEVVRLIRPLVPFVFRLRADRVPASINAGTTVAVSVQALGAGGDSIELNSINLDQLPLHEYLMLDIDSLGSTGCKAVSIHGPWSVRVTVQPGDGQAAQRLDGTVQLVYLD